MPNEILPITEPTETIVTPQTSSSGTQSSVPTIPTSTDYTQKEVERLNKMMIALVIGVVVAFMLGYYTFLYDTFNEKELHMRYSELYTNYLEKNAELERRFMDTKIEVNDFRNEIDLLKAKNLYLK